MYIKSERKGGARGTMVIIAGCGYGDTSSNPGPDWSYLPTPPLGQDMTQGQFFKRSLAGLNSEFSF